MLHNDEYTLLELYTPTMSSPHSLSLFWCWLADLDDGAGGYGELVTMLVMLVMVMMAMMVMVVMMSLLMRPPTFLDSHLPFGQLSPGWSE